MGESRPPLRAAFWAICAALLLMLLATLSDPYRVRQSLMARRAPARPTSEIATGPTGADHPFPSDPVPNNSLAPTDDAATAPEAAWVALPAAEPTARFATPTDSAPTYSAPTAGGAQMQVVSSGEAGNRRHIARPVERPAMPILSPGELTGPSAGGRFEELPPPPELGPERAPEPSLIAEADGGADEVGDLSREEERTLQRLHLETELLSLRHDLNLSIESRQIEQMQHLQQQQATLLERQQQTAERLEQLTEQLAAQSDRIDRLFESQVKVAAPQTVGEAFPHAATPVCSSDRCAPPVAHSPFVDPQLRYLAPPPAHSDPTPLSHLESPPEEPVSPGLPAPPPGAATEGPLFVPPSLCR